jgi:hypothetical protein
MSILVEYRKLYAIRGVRGTIQSVLEGGVK